MIVFPCAKINLGLNIVEKRPDGYHNLETVFYPIPIHDAIEATLMDDAYPYEGDCTLCVTGAEVAGKMEDNLVVKAYNIIAQDHKMPRVHLHLHKHIPMQAGLGGGSADAAYTIRLLNEFFNIGLSTSEMEAYAARLGADCAFFITTEPTYATGIGEIFEPVDTEGRFVNQLAGKWIALVKPEVAISTREAFAGIKPHRPATNCREAVLQPIETWRNNLTNDFEDSIFPAHQELADIKQKLYDLGAVYAQMSGSGSTLFGLFMEEPNGIEQQFGDCFTFVTQL